MKLKKIVFSALFIALGLVFPFLTGQIKEIGKMLLPMHIPVLLCGLILGWQYGVAVGFITPILRSICFSMPVMYPNAISMAFELATYGGVAGYIYLNSKWQCTKSLYRSMIIAFFVSRASLGITKTLLMGFGNYTIKMFVAGAFLDAIPGIIFQVVLIPVIMVSLKRAKFVPLVHKKNN